MGVILGPLLETHFRRALIISNGSYATFISDPISAIFLGAAPGTSFVVAWRFGRYAPEASSGMTRDSKKTPLLRNGGREALAPALLHEDPSAL